MMTLEMPVMTEQIVSDADDCENTYSPTADSICHNVMCPVEVTMAGSAPGDVLEADTITTVEIGATNQMYNIYTHPLTTEYHLPDCRPSSGTVATVDTAITMNTDILSLTVNCDEYHARDGPSNVCDGGDALTSSAVELGPVDHSAYCRQLNTDANCSNSFNTNVLGL